MLKPIPCQVRACERGVKRPFRGVVDRRAERDPKAPVYVVVPKRRDWVHRDTVKYNLFLNMSTRNVKDNPCNLLLQDTVKYINQEELYRLEKGLSISDVEE